MCDELTIEERLVEKHKEKPKKGDFWFAYRKDMNGYDELVPLCLVIKVTKKRVIILRQKKITDFPLTYEFETRLISTTREDFSEELYFELDGLKVIPKRSHKDTVSHYRRMLKTGTFEIYDESDEGIVGA